MQLLHAGQAVHESSQHVAPEERESSQSVPVSSPLSMQWLHAGQASHEHIVQAEREPTVGQAVHEPPFWTPPQYMVQAERESTQSVPVPSSFSVRSLHAGQAVHEPPKSLAALSTF